MERRGLPGGEVMTRSFTGGKSASLMAMAAGFALALTSAGWAQSSPQSDPAPSGNPPATTTQSAPPADTSTADQAPGTKPVAGDAQPCKPNDKAKKSDKKKKEADCDGPAPRR